ncbi:MAG: hypothetical protein IJ156_04820 [Bacteroidales bacterium]|nr:hypothetical protein [Bacteroidales bacterium]
MNAVSIGEGGLEVRLSVPGTFYRGTRFDWAGVFDAVVFRGVNLTDRWFERYEPTMHDAVCGPAEEFTPIGYGERETFLKIGVGRLCSDGNPYDRFRLYPVADAGIREMEESARTVRFRHVMPEYDYRKSVEVLSENAFCIRHRLDAAVDLKGQMYNHNFFTLGRFRMDGNRRLSFPFRPSGHWRSAYDSVALRENGIRFSRPLEKGESVFMGDLRPADTPGMPYGFRLDDAETGFAVDVRGDRPLSHMVFWANHRIACPEPYVDFHAGPDRPFELTISYFFQ